MDNLQMYKDYLRINISKEGIPCGCWMCREEEYDRKEYKEKLGALFKNRANRLNIIPRSFYKREMVFCYSVRNVENSCFFN